MRVSIACKSCRQKKTKCMHDGEPPCQSCKLRGKESTCKLHSTQEFRKMRKKNAAVQGQTGEADMPKVSDSIVRTSIESAVQHYPELLFLSSLRYQELIEGLDQLVLLGLCVLSAPFTSHFTSEKKKDLSLCLEIKLFEKIDDKRSLDLTTILQTSILMLIFNWQNGQTHKGYLIGGFAERAYILLSEQKYEHKTILEKELFIRTLWSYQLITLSLRKESLKEYQARLCKFPLPQNNSDILFKQAPNICYLNNLQVGSTNNLFALFIAVTELWADCSAWIIQGGKRHSHKVPWDETSEWSRLNKRLLRFKSQLGPKESLNMQSLDAFFALGQGSLYCCVHLALLTSRILLDRNYMPLIPSDDKCPKAPPDASPEWKNSPPNWWKVSARNVFESARDAALIYNECRKRNSYCCSTFAGFVALTCASMLFYIESFPSYDPGFKDAKIYYSYCVDYLKYYKSHWELGSYYYKFLIQTVDMFKAASNDKLTPQKISVFENMKDELIEIANVAAPTIRTDRIQIENLIENSDDLHQKHTCIASGPPNVTTEGLESWMNEKSKEKLCSLFGWENDWPTFDDITEFWKT